CATTPSSSGASSTAATSRCHARRSPRDRELTAGALVERVHLEGAGESFDRRHAARSGRLGSPHISRARADLDLPAILPDVNDGPQRRDPAILLELLAQVV